MSEQANKPRMFVVTLEVEVVVIASDEIDAAEAAFENQREIFDNQWSNDWWARPITPQDHMRLPAGWTDGELPWQSDSAVEALRAVGGSKGDMTIADWVTALRDWPQSDIDREAAGQTTLSITPGATRPDRGAGA